MPSEVLDIAKAIEAKISESELMRSKIKERASERARTASAYDLAMAKTIIRLKNGDEFDVEGVKIKDPINSLIDKIAKGLCWKEKLEMDMADGLYRSLISNLDAVQTELNGYQSIYKYLSKL